MAEIIRGVFPNSESATNLSIRIRRLVLDITTNAYSSSSLKADHEYLTSTHVYVDPNKQVSGHASSGITQYEQIENHGSLSSNDHFVIQPGEYYNYVDNTHDSPVSRLLSNPITEETSSNHQDFTQMDINDFFEELLLEEKLTDSSQAKNIYSPET